MAPLTLADLPTVAQLYKSGDLEPVSSNEALSSPSAVINSKVSLIRTSITDLQTTSIVNAANTSLLGGGGVDGAIHAAAGPDLLRECRTLGGCETGSAKITSAYDLPSQFIIHAVGPIYDRERRKRERSPAELLANCYQTSLELAADKGGSIAFSCLSTGVYGYPSGEAAKIACKTVRAFLESEEGSKLDRVVFCCFLEKDEVQYQRFLPIIFPPAQDNHTSPDERQTLASRATGASEPEGWVSIDKTDAMVESAHLAVENPSEGVSLAPDAEAMNDKPLATAKEGAAGRDVQNSLLKDWQEEEALALGSKKRRWTSANVEGDTGRTVRRKLLSQPKGPKPHDDEFGLERPPPRYNLEGGRNLDRKTGRRRYRGKHQKLFPSHHEPNMFMDDEPYSNSAYQAIEKIDSMTQELARDPSEDVAALVERAEHLETVRTFVRESAELKEWDPKRKHQSLESRMEGLMVKHGFDTIKPKCVRGEKGTKEEESSDS
ncbi:MAG: hypothetical protein Q9219_000715 [cf. Caloplaca sp. 3 TL-2023]